MNLHEDIDLSDIPEITDISTARRNPYAERLRKDGYTIVVNVSPEEIAAMTERAIEKINSMDMLELDPEEQQAFERYKKAHGCTP